MNSKELARFVSKTRWDESGCLLWAGARTSLGYGLSHWNGRLGLAHRAAYEHYIGPLPFGRKTVIHHVCNNPSCVWPLHLKLATQRENLLAGATTLNSRNASKRYCSNGHLFSNDNVRVAPSGQRVCRACKREWMRVKRKKSS
jgi:hypothetical protein